MQKYILPCILCIALLCAGVQKASAQKAKTISLYELAVYLGETYKVKMAYDVDFAKSIRSECSLSEVKSDNIIEEIQNCFQVQVLLVDDTYVITQNKIEVEETLYDLKGFLCDAESKELLPFANIYCQETDTWYTSNDKAYFDISKIPSEKVRLKFSYLGYEELDTTIQLFSEIKRVDFYMKSLPKQLESVVINEMSRSYHMRKDPGLSLISPRKFNSISNMGQSDVFLSLRYLPGIDATIEQSSGLAIRGGNTGHSRILLDGMQLFEIDHFYGMFSSLNNSVIKNVKVHKSYFDVEYGDAVSGIVDIKAKDGRSSEFKGDVEVNLLSANAYLEIPVSQKLSFMMAGRLAYTDLIQSSLYKDLIANISQSSTTASTNEVQVSKFVFKEETEPVMNFNDANIKAHFRPNDYNDISVSVFLSNDKLSSLNEENFYFGYYKDTQKQEWKNRGLGIQWKRQWDGRFYTRAGLSYSKFVNEYQNGVEYSVPGEYFDQAVYTDFNELLYRDYYAKANWQINEKTKFDFGLGLIRNTVEYSSTYSDSLVLDEIKSNTTRVYSYGQLDFKLWEGAGAKFGTRVSWDERSKTEKFEPRFSMHQHLGNNWNLKFALGRYVQYVNKSTSNLLNGQYQDLWLQANDDDIPLLKSKRGIIGVNYKKGKLLVDLEFYLGENKGVTEYVTDYFVYEDSVNYQFSSSILTGKSRDRGMDLLLNYRGRKWETTVSYSLKEVDNKFESVNDGKYYPSINDQRHEFKFLQNFEVKNWEFSLGWIYGSGKPYFSPETYSNYLDFGYVDNRTKKVDRKPAYHRMDISAVYSWELKTFSMDFGLSIFNVYNRKNIKERYYRSYTSSENGVEQNIEQFNDIKLLGRTPNFFVRVRF